MSRLPGLVLRRHVLPDADQVVMGHESALVWHDLGDKSKVEDKRSDRTPMYICEMLESKHQHSHL